MKPDNLSYITYIILGIVAGFVSFLSKDNYLGIAFGLAFYALGSWLIVKLSKEKRKQGWLMSNGGAIYFFLWFIVWILFYNL